MDVATIACTDGRDVSTLIEFTVLVPIFSGLRSSESNYDFLRIRRRTDVSDRVILRSLERSSYDKVWKILAILTSESR